MTSIEQAARQALEALRATQISNYHFTNEQAITALREALEHSGEANEMVTEQAEQEPVAWISSSCPKCSNKVRGTLGSGYMWWCTKCNFEWPVEAAAPVRTKDLTDDEIRFWIGRFPFLLNEKSEKWVIGLARAVIAADREKNK